ncbi:hypothetical protein CVT26_010901 [Gymnopilus dilepis]|uniref:PARG catalytic Macro domain-containing protein n=1 Tax=Gymnopilus dilepis TaxID=231916 RepID=A0A409VIJ6_9AGAR|nr:hypothetical protein CVT26_010901 [Gymnopilus dilepis]
MDVSSFHYTLPSHPSLRSLDPLGICDEDEPTIWNAITASIHSFRARSAPPSALHTLPQLVEDLSYSVHMDGHTNTKFLSGFISAKYPDPYSSDGLSLLNGILDHALLLPTLFESHQIPYLSEKNPTLRLSPVQVKCLLSHQILNTLRPPKGNDWGCTFTCWYSEPQALEDAVFGYLNSLFDFFTLPMETMSDTTYIYSTLPARGVSQTAESWMKDLPVNLFTNLTIEPVASSTVPFPHESVNCTLVASNSSPGFGASCTQEELVTAACPPLLLMGALLISPPVPDDVAIIVQTQAPIFQWKGKGREARRTSKWINASHTFLFLDASELDRMAPSDSAGLLDLDPKHFIRDLHKAYTGFNALSKHGIKAIASPIWGAGAFGADPIVKTIILSAASARAGIALYLSVDKEEFYPVHDTSQPHRLIDLLRRLRESCKNATIEAVVQKITSNEALGCRRGYEVLQLLEET